MISIIIPIYQVSDYVERCIRSVISQTYTDIECVIVDDATEDDSIDKCERLIRQYNLNENLDHNGRIRFKILQHEVNSGLSAARNTGTKAATGEYVFYLDGDDEITPDCIEKLVSLARKYPEAEMVIGHYCKTKENGRRKTFPEDDLPSYVASNEKIVSLYYTESLPTPAWNKLIKRSFLEEHLLYFKEGIVYEDMMWMFWCVKYLSVVAVLNEVTYHYLFRPGSITTNSDEYLVGSSFEYIYSEILTHLTRGREDKDLDRYMAGFCKWYLKCKSTIPAYQDLHHLYVERSRQYDCWQVYLVLVTIRLVGYFGNPSAFLGWLNNLRWKWKKNHGKRLMAEG